MLNACCGGARPGHDNNKGGLHDMNTLELPSGHLKIDPEGALFFFFFLSIFVFETHHSFRAFLLTSTNFSSSSSSSS
jgi:hypothetical protein